MNTPISYHTDPVDGYIHTNTDYSITPNAPHRLVYTSDYADADPDAFSGSLDDVKRRLRRLV